jgi:predicted nucleic acid-binding protein
VPFVLDASAIIPLAFADPNPYAEHVLDLLAEDDALVPIVWSLEVTNGLLVGERRGQLGTDGASRFLDLLRELDIIVDMTGMERILSVVLELGREQGLSSYDASYLELARREEMPLATADGMLQVAAGRVGVPLVAGPA